jgi:K+-transporting ATPase ATPase C chain
MRNISKELWTGLRITLLLALLTGIIYPLAMTGVSQAAFNKQANGSLVTDSKGNVVGSSLIGQCYYQTQTDSTGTVTAKTVQDAGGNDLYYAIDPKFFQSRPLWLWTTNANGTRSLVQPPCNAAASGGSNLGPSNPTLINAVTSYAKYLHSKGVAKNADGTDAPMPVDLVTGDFTGFDPDITEAGALAQVEMVAKARGLSADRVHKLVEDHVDGRALGIFGSPHVNVLALNQALINGAAG